MRKLILKNHTVLRVIFAVGMILSLLFLTALSPNISISVEGGNLAIFVENYKVFANPDPTITKLGTNADKNGTSPWTALSSLSISAGDYVIVCEAGDSATSSICGFWGDFDESADYGGAIYALTSDGSYIYAAGYTTQTVWKIDPSDMSKADESADYGGVILALAYDGSYIYAAGSTTQTVWKIYPSYMSKAGESADYGGTIYALASDGSYIYAAGYTTQTVWKIDPSDMSKADESAGYGGTIFALTYDGSYIYAAG